MEIRRHRPELPILSCFYFDKLSCSYFDFHVISNRNTVAVVTTVPTVTMVTCRGQQSRACIYLQKKKRAPDRKRRRWITERHVVPVSSSGQRMEEHDQLITDTPEVALTVAVGCHVVRAVTSLNIQIKFKYLN